MIDDEKLTQYYTTTISSGYNYKTKVTPEQFFLYYNDVDLTNYTDVEKSLFYDELLDDYSKLRKKPLKAKYTKKLTDFCQKYITIEEFVRSAMISLEHVDVVYYTKLIYDFDI